MHNGLTPIRCTDSGHVGSGHCCVCSVGVKLCNVRKERCSVLQVYSSCSTRERNKPALTIISAQLSTTVMGIIKIAPYIVPIVTCDGMASCV